MFSSNSTPESQMRAEVKSLRKELRHEPLYDCIHRSEKALPRPGQSAQGDVGRELSSYRRMLTMYHSFRDNPDNDDESLTQSDVDTRTRVLHSLLVWSHTT